MEHCHYYTYSTRKLLIGDWCIHILLYHLNFRCVCLVVLWCRVLYVLHSRLHQHELTALLFIFLFFILSIFPRSLVVVLCCLVLWSMVGLSCLRVLLVMLLSSCCKGKGKGYHISLYYYLQIRPVKSSFFYTGSQSMISERLRVAFSLIVVVLGKSNLYPIP